MLARDAGGPACVTSGLGVEWTRAWVGGGGGLGGGRGVGGCGGLWGGGVGGGGDGGGDGRIISQAIQAPSPTCPGTTYPVRVSPHSDSEICRTYRRRKSKSKSFIHGMYWECIGNIQGNI